ncbi:hypothetical protein [uncultured Alsobacter sp.]|uniref:hypothetical protein n=1 Tax=uncultured Alsobacter sp. TaxID=1748258 RepID=UPI0025E708BA|nr:hypothetical protein [uncultured Alsobacter sp.]
MSASLHPSPTFGRRVAAHEPEAAAAGTGRLTVLLAIAAGLVVGGLAFGLRPAPPPAPKDVVARIGAQVLNIPAGLVRTHDGEGRVDLAVRWADLGPAATTGTSDKTAAPRIGDVLLVTLSAADPATTRPDRLGSLYARFLETAVKAGPANLIERKFKAGTPYENQELLFSPPDGRRFLAVCDAKPRAGEVLPPLCTTRFERNGIAVQIRFEPRLVESWERIESGLTPLVDRWMRPAG